MVPRMGSGAVEYLISNSDNTLIYKALSVSQRKSLQDRLKA